MFDKRFVAKIEKRLSLKDAIWSDKNEDQGFTQDIKNFVSTNYEMTQYDLEAEKGNALL